MSRNITSTKKLAQNFHKSGALAQIDQIKYDFFFRMAQKHKAIILSGSQKPQALFLGFMLFFNIAVEKFGKKINWSSWSSRKDLSKPRISRFQVQIL